MKFICLDTETTGLYPHTDEILQLAIIDNDGKVLFNRHFKPTRHERWDVAESINHISPKDVENEKPFEFYRGQIQRIINRYRYIIGYNHRGFDIPFLEKNGITFKDKRICDVMFSFAEWFGDWNDYFNSYKWQPLTTATGCFPDFDESLPMHDALTDCIATLFVYNKLFDEECKRLRCKREYGIYYYKKTRYGYLLYDHEKCLVNDFRHYSYLMDYARQKHDGTI